jgi:hypothetical protein
MDPRNRTDPDSAVATAFRDRIGRLERPEPHASEAALLRICLARSRSIGLRQRLGLELASGRPA